MARDLIFGVHSVSEWLEADPSRLELVYTLERPNDRLAKLLGRVRKAGVRVETISMEQLRRLCGPRNAQGVAAQVAPFPYADLDEVLAEAGPAPLVLAVDGVTDPGNLGAIIRSAAFFGATAVVLPRDRSAAISPIVERSAAGGLARVPICRVNSLLRAVEGIRERGLQVLGSIVGHHPAPSMLDLTGPLCVLVGSEGKGLRPSVRRVCDLKTALPSLGPASLNVSAFTGILLYEISRQRLG